MHGSRKCSAFEKTVGCEFKAYLEAINEADTVIVVYDPDDPRCEREAAAVAVAEMLNTQVVTVDPKTIRLFKFEVIPYYTLLRLGYNRV